MLKYINETSQRKVEEFGAQYLPFGLFGIINYPVSFFILYYLGGQTDESLIIRIFATLVCFPLVIKDKWPLSLQTYLPLYWHFALLYCIPVFATYMLIKNHFSVEWLMNTSLGFFWLILLVDWITFIVLMFLGICLGFILYVAINGNIDMLSLIQANDHILFAAYLYLYAVMIGLIFARNKLTLENEKAKTLKSLSSSIAHEMRTPLSTTQAIATNIENLTHEYGKEPRLLSATDKQFLINAAQDLKELTARSNLVINMTLANLKSEAPTSRELHSIKTCVEESLNQYPFLAEERQVIHLNLTDDFNFQGNKNMMQHILFNLLANSLYFIKAEQKGEIYISLELQQKWNVLCFKDTAKGIAARDIPHLFDHFFSKRPHGTGVGLAFCKQVMEALGGKITCESVEKEYATFKLFFPLMNYSPG